MAGNNFHNIYIKKKIFGKLRDNRQLIYKKIIKNK